ncbi:MAG: DUF6476 family protein [Pseudomonadota bacterium]
MTGTHPPSEAEAQEPPQLRTLRWLVTALTAVMIVGISAIVILLALRLSAPSAPVVPDALSLPEGHSARAVTLGTGWTAVVTEDADGAEHILVFRPDGTVRDRVPLSP